MKTGVGQLGWASAVFWASTPPEFWAAFDGWVEANCVKRDDAPLTDEELFTLDDMKRRFPDEPAGRKQKRRKGDLPEWLRRPGKK